MLISSGETGLDAIRSNYFTLAKWLLLVARAQWYCVHKGLRLIEQEEEGEGTGLLAWEIAKWGEASAGYALRS